MRAVPTIALLLIACTARAQEPADDEVEVKKLTVRPAAAPPQALRYTLLPRLRDRTPGNALTLYYRAFSPEWWGQIQRDAEFYKKTDAWLAAPLKDLHKGGAAWLTHFRALQEIDRGARREYCDWELTDRLRQDGIGTLLPDLQSMRTFATLLAVRFRVELAAGDFDKAVYTLQTGFSVARHCGEGPTLIHGLVGFAIGSTMLTCLEEFIQQPGAPNLYWALTGLSRGLIDLRRGIEGEEVMVGSFLPELRELEKGPMTVERARAVLDEVFRKSDNLGAGRLGPSELLARAASLALAYPRSKERLVAAGRAPAEVEAMPAAQAVLLDTLSEFYRLRDEQFKAFDLPFTEARPVLDRASADIKKSLGENRQNVLLWLFGNFLPATEKVYLTSARADRKIASLRAVEAVRLHAAANGGRPPEKLSDVTAVPVPNDPATGKPFEYAARGTAAELAAPHARGFPKSRDNAWRYELTFVK